MRRDFGKITCLAYGIVAIISGFIPIGMNAIDTLIVVAPVFLTHGAGALAVRSGSFSESSTSRRILAASPTRILLLRSAGSQTCPHFVNT
jgi:hypothetical protein